MNSSLNPRTNHYEFFGPPGALFVTLSVPLTTYALFFLCSDSSGGCPPSMWAVAPRFVEAAKNSRTWIELFELGPFITYLLWYAFCVLAWYLLPGAWIDGTAMRDGKKKTYKINGICPPKVVTSRV